MPAVISIMDKQTTYNFNAKSYYYHVCVISRSGNYNAVLKAVKRISSDFLIIAVGYGVNPFVHAHLVIRSRRKIDFRKYHVPGLFVKFIPIRDKLHFNNVVKYVSNHPETFIYHDEHNGHRGGVMSEGMDDVKEILMYIQKQIDIINRRINALEKEIESAKTETVEETATVERKTLADKVRAKAQTHNGRTSNVEPERIEVRTRIATFVFQKSRKGVAIRIRFASFVKPNQKGEYYLALTPDEFKALVTQINNASESFCSSGSRNSGKKSSNVNVQTGFKKALEG